ncbi:tannase/feruloyl esterase family alpha/beta hydrolase [Ideonella azotifigens]|uniref:Tannase/feruloyl esterase family alpha/beta hydrolase n=1 Tax=Ideonella azotifigens TaxID=513160 RepID=A0ABN1KGV8_9BURK|nr:tannase/feruloyl esterase family alpha/beta hydrolase [Ideonella azotifigens]MCD2340316.1 tannase/feruloyl esterase family alpha/beta hydrolase [Ideonella azotifigens]
MEKTTMLRRRAASWWALTTAFAAALPLSATAAPPIANLPAVPALMQCSLPAFQALNLSGVADDGGQVSFSSATLVDVSSSNPAAYCAVRGVISPGASSIVMNLPMATWTQRYVQNGCGGECGNDNLGAPTQSSGCVPVVKGQLVTATTNMGHTSAQGSAWIVNNPWAAIDFAYRGVHVTAQVAKAVIQQFYGQPATYSYFDGCSDGGREALMSAQRYPNDFNGITAGAPANNMDVQNTYHHANRLLTNQSTPGTIPLPARNTYLLLRGNLPYIHAKVVAACDALDGVSDGIIDDPRACKFDTNTLVCANNGNESGCLTQAQADAAFRIHDGAKSVAGHRLEPEIASEWGSELDWTLYMPDAQGGTASSENFVTSWLYKTYLNEPYLDEATSTPRTINDLTWKVPAYRKTVKSSQLYSATNPNLTPFAAAGGKLMLWHGWADQHISPQGTLQYWETMTSTTANSDDFARFYLFPGMGHCGSGLGPNTFDVLTPMMSWVETGTAPYALVANNATTGVSRPVYPYPTVARYVGSGSTNDAANFKPFTPKKKSGVKVTNAGDYLYSADFPQVHCTALGTQIACDTGD